MISATSKSKVHVLIKLHIGRHTPLLWSWYVSALPLLPDCSLCFLYVELQLSPPPFIMLKKHKYLNVFDRTFMSQNNKKVLCH